MTRFTKATFVACLSVLAAASSVAIARADDPTPPAVPASLQAPAGHQPYLMAHAVGTQNYICLGAGLPWSFIGPQATVFDGDGEQSLTHFLSPSPAEGGSPRATWQDSKDTSAVWALAVASSIDPDYVAAGAVPWLLLQVTGTHAGPTGGDRLTTTTFIQRVNTTGGIAPAGVCPAAGARAFVRYEADYVLFRAR